jgi:hypothetical protein
MLTRFVGRKTESEAEGTCQTAKHSPAKLLLQGRRYQKSLRRALSFFYSISFILKILKKVFKGLVFLFPCEKDLPFNVRQETEDRSNVIRMGERNVFMV